MTDGSQSVTILHECIFQLLPLPVNFGFKFELLHTLTITDILLRKEAIKGGRFTKVDHCLIPLGLRLCLFRKVCPKHLIDHLLKGDATQTVVGVYASIRCYGEVEQQRRVTTHRFIIGIHQLRQTLHVLVFCVMIEPARANAGISLTWHP